MMRQITKINENIARLTIPYKDIYTTVYVITSERGAILFDTASGDEDAEKYIIPMLNELGVTKEELKFVFISHNHRDHAWGLGRIMQEYPDACIVSANPLLKETYEAFNFLMPADGDIIMDDFCIVTIPGHTEDSMALLDTRTNMLITGDCLQLYGIFGSEDWASNIGLPLEHIEAINKVSTMDIECIYMAHDYHPMGFKACGKDEVSRALEACIAPINRVRDIILNNPDFNDEEVRREYNASGNIPTISTRLPSALRALMTSVQMQ